MIELTAVQTVIREAVAEHPAQLARSTLAKMLVGSESVRVVNHSDSPYFGRLSHLRRKDILHNIDVLLQQKLLELDRHQSLILPSL